MVNKDGQFSFSKIIVLNGNSPSAQLVIFPNPAKNSIQISNINGNAKVSLFNPEGKLMLERFGVKSGDRIDITQLQGGIYFIQIQGIGNRKYLKLVKE